MFPVAKQYCISLFQVIKINIDSIVTISKMEQRLMKPSLCLLDPQIVNWTYY